MRSGCYYICSLTQFDVRLRFFILGISMAKSATPLASVWPDRCLGPWAWNKPASVWVGALFAQLRSTRQIWFLRWLKVTLYSNRDIPWMPLVALFLCYFVFPTQTAQLRSNPLLVVDRAGICCNKSLCGVLWPQMPHPPTFSTSTDLMSENSPNDT